MIGEEKSPELGTKCTEISLVINSVKNVQQEASGEALRKYTDQKRRNAKGKTGGGSWQQTVGVAALAARELNCQTQKGRDDHRTGH